MEERVLQRGAVVGCRSDGAGFQDAHWRTGNHWPHGHAPLAVVHTRNILNDDCRLPNDAMY